MGLVKLIIHSAPQFQIYFGDAKDRMYPQEYCTWNDTNILRRKEIQPIIRRLQLHELFFLRQVHGKEGVAIDLASKKNITPFQHKGDFLITNQLQYGIGVVTADCLPIIVYDRKHNASGIAHVGWRGAIAGVVIEMFEAMKLHYKTVLDDCTIFWGPSAKRCCYQVSDDFKHNLEAYSFAQEVLHTSGAAQYFDLPLFVELQLYQYGISSEAMRKQYNACTICDIRFHSHRRSTMMSCSNEGRQMTIIAIK